MWLRSHESHTSGFNSPEFDRRTNTSIWQQLPKENVVVSSQAMRAPARPVDLSVASAPLWLAATTLLAIYFVGIDQGAV
jgi:hypothetical protein